MRITWLGRPRYKRHRLHDRYRRYYRLIPNRTMTQPTAASVEPDKNPPMHRSPTHSDNPPAAAGPPNHRLVVFSDDWGRHPSSCQHLVGHLLDRHCALWVNTIGTRPPRLSAEDFGKAATKIIQWLSKPTAPQSLPANLQVINPAMYPGFRRRWQRRLNARLVTRAVNRALGPRDGQPRVAITTLPITADLVGRLDVDRWVYYCVDDFSVWPGLDGTVIDDMERHLVSRVDRAVAVSETLQQRLRGMGKESQLLTHGIDLSHWGNKAPDENPHSATNDLPTWWSTLERPILLFWGVVDRRLDTAWCQALAQRCGSLVLLGPQQSPDPTIAATPRVNMPGPVSYGLLPTLAAAADVLVMPYADLPVTRAIQPLKLKEYLATSKPAVVRSLPATVDWSDAADVVDNLEELVRTVTQRATHGTPDSQHDARRRLHDESWDAKAKQLEQSLIE